MKLENQVVSLELSQKLKSLGVKQESLFKWHCKLDDNLKQATPYEIIYYPEEPLRGSMVSTFTVAELGEMLPKDLYMPYKTKTGEWNLSRRRKIAQHPHCFFTSTGAQVNYTGGTSNEYITQGAATEADARAKMLIFLIENKLI